MNVRSVFRGVAAAALAVVGLGLAAPVAAYADVQPGVAFEMAVHLGGPDGAQCADVINASTAEGAPLQIFHCNGTVNAAQRFFFIPMGDGFYQISNEKSSKCLEPRNGSDQDGIRIVQVRCLGLDVQQWKLQALFIDHIPFGTGPVYGLVNKALPGRCMQWLGTGLIDPPVNHDALVSSQCRLPTAVNDATGNFRQVWEVGS
jgi:hypothetical protein